MSRKPERYVDTDGFVWEYVESADWPDDVPAHFWTNYGRCAKKPNGSQTCSARCCTAWRSHGFKSSEELLEFFLRETTPSQPGDPPPTLPPP